VTLSWGHWSRSRATDSAGKVDIGMMIGSSTSNDSSHVSACKAGIGYARKSFPLNYSAAVELTLVPASPDSSHGVCRANDE